MRAPLIGFVLFFNAVVFADLSRAQPRAPEEPGADVVASGKCEVPVCTDIDFGDHSFRYYASGRAIKLTFIPKGACKCASIRSGNSGFNGQIVVAVTTSEKKVFPNVSVLRVQKGWNPNTDTRTSWERFKEIEQQLVQFPGFASNGDDFAEFNVFVRPRVYPSNRRYLYFVPPQRQFKFRGETQPIIFDTALGYEIGTKEEEERKEGPRVNAHVRLTNTIHLFEFFVPRLVRSNDWIASIEKVSEAIDTRLFRKGE